MFLVPGEEMTVYIHLPKLSMSASRLLKDKYGQEQKAWFDGGASALNAELATWGYPLSMNEEPGFEELATWGYPLSMNEEPGFEDLTSGLSADEYAKYVKHHYAKYEKALQHDEKVGEAYRQYVLLNLKMNELVALGHWAQKVKCRALCSLLISGMDMIILRIWNTWSATKGRR